MLENHFHNQLRARLLGCEAITQLVRRPPLPRANTSTARASFPARCRMTHRRVESHDWCLLQSGREAVVSCRHPGWRLLHRPRLQAYKQPGRSEGGVLWRADVPSYRRRHRTPRLRRPPPSMARTSAGVLRTLPFLSTSCGEERAALRGPLIASVSVTVHSNRFLFIGQRTQEQTLSEIQRFRRGQLPLLAIDRTRDLFNIR